jgi:co-chaperonin GroES (HSP10)
MELKAFGDRIIFRALPSEEQTVEKVGSLYIPQAVQDQAKQQRRNYKGEALIVGDECKFITVGSIVAYDEYGVASFFHEGEELLIVREKDLIGMYK